MEQSQLFFIWLLRASLSLSCALLRSAVRRCIHARRREIIACPPHSTPNKRAVLMRASLPLSVLLAITRSFSWLFLLSLKGPGSLSLLSCCSWRSHPPHPSTFGVRLAELGAFRRDGGDSGTSCGAATPPLNGRNERHVEEKLSITPNCWQKRG